jgi:hypothetical protein
VVERLEGRKSHSRVVGVGGCVEVGGDILAIVIIIILMVIVMVTVMMTIAVRSVLVQKLQESTDKSGADGTRILVSRATGIVVDHILVIFVNRPFVLRKDVTKLGMALGVQLVRTKRKQVVHIVQIQASFNELVDPVQNLLASIAVPELTIFKNSMFNTLLVWLTRLVWCQAISTVGTVFVQNNDTVIMVIPMAVIVVEKAPDKLVGSFLDSSKGRRKDPHVIVVRIVMMLVIPNRIIHQMAILFRKFLAKSASLISTRKRPIPGQSSRITLIHKQLIVANELKWTMGVVLLYLGKQVFKLVVFVDIGESLSMTAEQMDLVDVTTIRDICAHNLLQIMIGSIDTSVSQQIV